MRVFEIAKHLDVPSAQIIKDLKRYHVRAKNHMSSVDDKVVRKLLALYEKRKIKEQEKSEELKRKKEEEEARRKAEEEERKRREEEERKQREEEERKRREEEQKRLEEERRRKEEALRLKKMKEEEERRQKRLEQSSSRLTEALQKRQIGSQRGKKEQQPRERRPARAKHVKEKPQRQQKTAKAKPDEITPGETLFTPTEKERQRKKKTFKKRDKYTGEDEKGRPKDKSKKRIRPTIFVAPPKPSKDVMPPMPQRQRSPDRKVEQKPKVVELRGEITVNEFAEKIGIPVADIVKKLIEIGEPMTVNQMINADLCELLAGEFNVQINIVEESDERDIEPFLAKSEDEKNMILRPPVATVMGHVDHGKTTLLDKIRQTDVVGQEYGGITQHIGAYFVQLPGGGSVTFLDTPGHEAFTKMRARGAQATDIVVLIVAANDGVMPQTVEAINHSRAAGVPIIVAINKIDLPEADTMRVKQELMKYELVPEEFGGDTLFAEISAKHGKGIEALLEMILLQAEIMELKANPKRTAVGVVIESHLDPLRGPLATILVQQGTLKAGDVFLSGTQTGKVRAMQDSYGRAIQAAGPSFPVEVVGFNGVPEVGETFVVVPNERTARRIVETRQSRRQRRATMAAADQRVSLESLHDFVKEGKIKELRIILKGDVQGSIEAIRESLEKLSTDEVRVATIHQGVGRISESDVDLAVASDAVIIGFNTVPDPGAKAEAEKENVDIKLYRVIYDLIDDVKKSLVGMLEPRYEEVYRSRLSVKQAFKISRLGVIAGCLVDEGEITINDKARLIRDDSTIYEGSVISLRRVKEDVRSVKAGTECGVKLANFNDIKPGDLIETYQLKEIQPVLSPNE